MKVLLAQPRGFCAGVTRAIAIVERALAIYGAPIYVRHEIVHNRTVVNSLRERGAVFVDNLAEVPEGATVVFSAHGVPRAVSEEAERRGFRVFDATCPLVTKVHREVARMRAEGRTVLMIGHAGHPEVEGTMGQVDGGIELVENTADVAALPYTNDDSLAYVTQTTISADDSQAVIDALRHRFPFIQEPKRQDICYATTNRQEAVKLLARSGVDIVLVIGSATSSNSNRLREVAEREGARAYLMTRPSTSIPSGSRALHAWASRRVPPPLNPSSRACFVILRPTSTPSMPWRSKASRRTSSFRFPRDFARRMPTEPRKVKSHSVLALGHGRETAHAPHPPASGTILLSASSI